MKQVRLFLSIALLPVFLVWNHHAHAQTGFDLKIDKPAPYEERVLRAEKTGRKKLTAPGKFLQGLTSHYNYYFNASNKLNDVIGGAKLAYRDDYTQLLPFYNYQLDQTAQNTLQLDSVIYKAQTGIVMHDLRNNWVDNLYLLWGAAWFFEKKFDSAALMFQFINYAFAEKEKDGYYRYIGSRMDGNNALSIATREKEGFSQKLSVQPSRNMAFIWQTRTQMELGNMAEAATLIATLKNDPFFPERLKGDLEELQAYYFYKQNQWDSAALHLTRAFGQAPNKTERGRWEYLAGQLFEKAGLKQEASDNYARAIVHTTDPVLEVYARLNMVRLNGQGGEDYIAKNIAELLKMAKRDKYADYRDIIYFMAAQMELERKNPGAAQELLLKSAKYNTTNPASRNRSYLLIADLSYDRRQYAQAAAFYDSIQVYERDQEILTRVSERKAILSKILRLDRIFFREDSLQRIAALPEEERTVYVTRLLKQLRKQQGLNEEGFPTAGGLPVAGSAPVDLFSSSQAKGDWYFYNTTLKAKGISQFKQTWGNRPNVDNWRRFADVNQQLLTQIPTNSRDASKAALGNIAIDNTPSFNNLMNNLPLTPAQLERSNDSIQFALFNLGMAYQEEMEDYVSAIQSFEALRARYPKYVNTNEVIYHLYFAYRKAGDEAKAEEMKKLLLSQYPSSRFAAIVATGKDPVVLNNKSPEVTKAYESIYDLFIEGRFEEAEAAKKKADSAYRTSYWQPQLLYIEAVYQIRRREDSLAKNTLQTLIAQSPNGPLTPKATNLLEVLGRRAQIEAELTSLQVQRPVEDSASQKPVSRPVVQTPPPVVQKAPDPSVQKDTTHAIVNTPPPSKPIMNVPADTVKKKPVVQAPATAYVFAPEMKHYFMIVLDKVDPMFVTEVKNAFDRYNRERFYNQTFQVSIRDLDSTRKLVLVGDFGKVDDAMNYYGQAKRIAPNEVIPWLKREKYQFSIVSEQNLEIFILKKDLPQYSKFLDQNLPGKF